MTPSLKTCLELSSSEVAPTNAEELVNGVTTTLSGTPVKASLPPILRAPSLSTGFVLRNMECFHVLVLIRKNPREKIFWLLARNGET